MTLFVLRFQQWSEIAAVRSRTRRTCTHLCPRHGAAAQTRQPPKSKLTQLNALEKQLPQPNWQQILTTSAKACRTTSGSIGSLSIDGKSASLTGASYTDGGVYDFVGYLKQVPDISEIALEGTGVGQSATGPTTNFTLQLTLANLADRSEKEARP